MKIYHIPAAPPLYTNTFLLVGENGLAAAVDPAAGAQEYLRLLEQEGRAADAYPADARPLRPCGRSGGTAAENGCEGLAGPAGRVRRCSFFRSPRRTTPMRTERRSAWTRVSRSASSPRPATARVPSAAVRRSAVQRRHAVRGGRGPYGPARRQLGHTAGKPEKAVRRSDGKRAGPARPRGVFHHGPGTGEQSVSAILTKR